MSSKDVEAIPPGPRCSECVHFHHSPNVQLGTGECWRFPPQPTPTPNGMLCVAPRVKKEYRCGEFKRKDDNGNLLP